MKACGSLALCIASASAFSSPAATPGGRRRGAAALAPLRASRGGDGPSMSRGAFLAASCALSTALVSSATPASAADDAPPAEEPARPTRSIRACSAEDDCVSTANIKDAKGSYSPPWTFEVSPDEAFARIKGVLASDDAFVVTEVDDEARYVRAYARRVSVDQDEVEFLVRGGDDRVVLFRSSARRNGSVSDFGANRRRVDEIRRRGAVFDLMGGGATADSYDGGGAAGRGNGMMGQLKAFYGLQSGAGFEGVFEEGEY